MDGYNTLGRDGLASAYSYLDGVPFKIGASFRCPPKVKLPEELSSISTQSVVHVDYTYETEEAVLAWAKAREVALMQAAQDQTDKAKAAQDEAQQRLETESAAASCQAQGSEGVSPQGAQSGEPHNATQNGGVRPKPPVPHRPSPPKIAPKPMVEPGAILKPTVASKPQSSDSDDSNGEKQVLENKKVDLTLFEQESDPFDNAELQTINTMEELKVLLDTRPTPAPRKKIENKSEDTDSSANGNAHENNMYGITTNVQQNNWVSFDDDLGLDQSSDRSKIQLVNPVPLSASDSCDKECEYDYVQLQKDYKLQQDVHNNSVINTHTSQQLNTAENSLGGNLPSSLANSKMYKPVLPPIPGPPKDGETLNNTSDLNRNQFLSQQYQTLQQGQAGNTNPSFLSNSQFSNPMPTNQNTTIPSRLSSGEPVFLPPAVPNSNPPQVPKSIPPPLPNRPENPNARMWSSMGPTLASSLDELGQRPTPMARSTVGQVAFGGSSSDVSSKTVPQTGNPYSRHSNSTADLVVRPKEPEVARSKTPNLDRRKSPNLEPLPSTSPRSTQPFNCLRPLPPPPAPKPSHYKDSQLKPSAQMGLTDPYLQLSREAQVFTDNLSSMGFLRARVARAVDKFGQDEREVLDHLLAVDQMVERKYAPVLVEEALHKHKNDVVKCEKYMAMLIQFEGLGFKRENVQEALVTAEMDHDKTLDLLTT